MTDVGYAIPSIRVSSICAATAGKQLLKVKASQLFIFLIIIIGIVASFVLIVTFGPQTLAFVHLNIAKFELSHGSYARAAHELNTAIELNPTTGEAYYLRATIEHNSSDYPAALADYSSAISNGWNTPDVLLRRAMILHLCGCLSPALGDYESYLKLVPDDANVLANIADIQFRQGDFSDVVSNCNKALKKDPKCLLALANRATYFLHVHRPVEAVADMNIVLANRQSLAVPAQLLFITRAMAYRQSGDSAKATADLKTARSLVVAPSHNKRELSKKLEHEFKNVIRRPRFVLCTDQSSKDSAKMVDFLERLLRFFDTNLHCAKVDPDFHVFVFPTKERYVRHLIESGRRDTDLFGNFDQSWDAMFTTPETGFGTLAHELTHKVLEDVPFLDNWAREGIPTLFEKLYGYPVNDTYSLLLGCQNSWRIKELGEKLTSWQLSEVIAQQYPSLSESEERLAAVFLYNHGKLGKYMELSRTGEIGSYATIFEAAFDKPAVELQPEWHRYLKQIQGSAEGIDTLPLSTIFPDKQSFDKFARSHLNLFPNDQGQSK